MELHERLYALGVRLGREVFDDSDSLRGALDDFMDEGAASTGDINLLTDAVRLGAFRWMLGAIESGSEPARAVEAAGEFLSRERGSADVAGSRWACAVLGYAVGKVSDTDVRRFRTMDRPFPQPGNGQLPPPPPPPTGMAPFGDPSPPAPTAPYPANAPASLGSQPTHWAGGPPTGPGQPGQPGGGYGGPAAPAPQWSPQPPPPPRSSAKVWLILVAIVAVIAVVGGISWIVLAKPFDKNEAKPPGPSDTITTTAPSEPTDDPTAFDSIDVRFSGLGTRVTTGLSACQQEATLSAQTEHLSCTFDNGKLELATYESTSDLLAARDVVVNFDTGGRYSEQTNGVFFSQQRDNGDAMLYWDSSRTRQTATYTASNPRVKLDSLVSMFESTGTSLGYPIDVENTPLSDWIRAFVKPQKCERVQTNDPGETEESKCSARGGITVYVAHMADRSELRNYRQGRLATARDRGGEHRLWQYSNSLDVDRGWLGTYTTDDGYALRYWDLADCLCYAEAYDYDGDTTHLENWWVKPFP
jgi:hypothetical protein